MDFDTSSNELLQKFKDNFKNPECKYCSKIVDGHIFIDVPTEDDHFWSPQLHIEIEEDGNNKATVKGLFGPKPQVWTLFMFIHFAVAISFLIFAVMAYSRWSLKENIVFPIIMLIALPSFWLVLYFLGKIGKETGHTQMEELHSFMLKTLEKND